MQSTLTIDENALIDNNAGVHYAGGVFIYNGGYVFMDGGTISNNFAWSKGGGVWAMSEVYGTAKFRTPGTVKYVSPAGFSLGHPVISNGKVTGYEGTGVIKGNLSVSRGGGINVSSNNVALFSGQLLENGTRTTGGGVYVEGDAEDHMYQLYFAKGWITDNHAVKENSYWWGNSQPEQYKQWNAYLDRGLPADGNAACEFDNTLTAGSSRTGNYSGSLNVQGNGGGLWMCAFGGNSTIDYTGIVEIGGNTANPVTYQWAGGSWDSQRGNNLLAYQSYTYDNYGGNDIMVSPGLPGDGSALNIVGDAKTNGATWTNDNKQGAEIESNRVYTGGLGLTNSTYSSPASTEGGVLVSGNLARLGGGLGSDGTMVFGNDDDVYRFMQKFRFTKSWGEGIEKEPLDITLNVQAKDPQTGEYVDVSNIDNRLNFTLDGEADNGNLVAKEIEPWVGEIGLPLAVNYVDSQGNSQVISPYTFITDDGVTLDPSKTDDLKKLYELVASGKLTKDNLKLNDWRIKATETTKDGSLREYIINLGDIEVTELGAHGQKAGESHYASSSDADGTYVHFDTKYIDIQMNQTLSNENVKVEKYVNKKVHADISEFDRTFTYDVMAYVPAGSTEVTIEDTLIDDLMFVDSAGNSQYVSDGNGGKKVNDSFDSSKVVVNNSERSMLVLSKNNNHKGDGTGTVATLDSSNDGTLDPSGKVTVSGQKITVKLDEATIKNITKDGDSYTGTWVRASFDAQIAPDKYDALLSKLKGENVSADDLTWSNINDSKTGTIEGVDDEKIVEMYTNPGKNRYYVRTMYHDTSGNEVYNWYGRWITNSGVSDFGWYKIPDGLTDPIGPKGGKGLYSYSAVNKNADGSVAYPAVEESQWDTVANESTNSTTHASRAKLTDWFFTTVGKANWPVLDGADTDNGAHEGLPNSAGYTVKFSNGNTYTYDTNTVTVKPEYTKVKVKKEFADGWPSGVSEVKLDVKLDGKVIQTLTVNEQNPEAESAEIAKLVDMSRYTVAEQPIAGFEGTVSGDAANGFIVTNNVKKHDVLISKNALGGDEIDDAKMKLTDAEGNLIEEWISSADGPHELKLLEGEYVLEEVVSPAGFKRVTTKMHFKVKADGTVELVTTEVDNGGKLSVLDGNHVKLEDAPVNVEISKNALGGDEIDGAKIKVVGPDDFTEEWTSSADGPHVLKNLKPGEYVMTEVVAPDGYQRVTTEMKFKVDEGGNVELLTVEVDNGGKISILEGDHIVLEDAPVTANADITPEKEDNPTIERAESVEPGNQNGGGTGDAVGTGIAPDVSVPVQSVEALSNTGAELGWLIIAATTIMGGGLGALIGYRRFKQVK